MEGIFSTLRDRKRLVETFVYRRAIDEDAAVSLAGHKTTSAHKRYKIGGAQVQPTVLGAVSKAR